MAQFSNSSSNKRSRHDVRGGTVAEQTSKSSFSSMLKSFKKVKPPARKEEDEDSEEEWTTAQTRSFHVPDYDHIMQRVKTEIQSNPLVGFPAQRPTCQPNLQGWFYPAHRCVLASLLNKDTKFVVELGSWFGKSTRFLCDTAPNAHVFAVDIWDNSFSAADTHYQNTENQNLVNEAPLLDVFLTNCWEYKDQLVPMRMQTVDGLNLLHKMGVKPSVIFIDADHHYEPVVRDISTALKLFPDAIIVGDDWRYPDVQKAVKEFAASHNKKLHVEGNTCWSFASFDHPATTRRDLEVSRARYDDNNAQASIPEFLSLYNTLKIDDAKSMENFAIATQFNLNMLSRYKGHRGRSLLMLAARNGRHRVCKKLVEMGADVNIQSKKGEYALHIAARMGDIEIVGILIQAGADQTLLDSHGKTAKQISRETHPDNGLLASLFDE